tara:strand:- start:202 stop:495 length:294 start_codon:yes stop_codon:yes gene_type:complete
MEIEWEEIKTDLEQENQMDEEKINKQIKQTIMTKYEIVKETSFTGVVLYSIEREGKYILNSCDKDLNKVEGYLENIIANNDQESIKETIKVIEVYED